MLALKGKIKNKFTVWLKFLQWGSERYCSSIKTCVFVQILIAFVYFGVQLYDNVTFFYIYTYVCFNGKYALFVVQP